MSLDANDNLILLSRLRRLLTAPHRAGFDARILLFTPTPPGELGRANSDHVAADRDDVDRLLSEALLRRPTTSATGQAKEQKE